MKNVKTGRVALAGVLTALAVGLLLLTFTPVATVGTVALAALCGIPVVVELGRKAGWLHVVAVVVLAWLIVPSVEGKLLYTAFFGWYTIAKAWLEQKGWFRPVEWAVKFLMFWTAIGLGRVGAYFLLDAKTLDNLSWWVLPLGTLVANLLFVLYDRCLTGLVGLYLHRLHPLLKRLFRF